MTETESTSMMLGNTTVTVTTTMTDTMADTITVTATWPYG